MQLFSLVVVRDHNCALNIKRANKKRFPICRSNRICFRARLFFWYIHISVVPRRTNLCLFCFFFFFGSVPYAAALNYEFGFVFVVWYFCFSFFFSSSFCCCLQCQYLVKFTAPTSVAEIDFVLWHDIDSVGRGREVAMAGSDISAPLFRPADVHTLYAASHVLSKFSNENFNKNSISIVVKFANHRCLSQRIRMTCDV